MDLYIYYRVHVRDAEIFRAKVLAMQDNLARLYGVRTALKRRPDEQDDMHTWMEVYLDAAEDFEAKLELAIGAHQLLSLIDGKRHTEQFLDLSLCA
ncbi:MAG: DUF4936 family protein [Pseudomonadota bacterium]|jgi:hypothetical protein